MVASMRVRAAGWSVAVIDFRPLGGTCALRGCDPKKMLISGAAAVDHVRRMQGKGVVGDSRIHWHELMAFKRSFTDPVPQKNEQRYADKGIDTYHGRAWFTELPGIVPHCCYPQTLHVPSLNSGYRDRQQRWLCFQRATWTTVFRILMCRRLKVRLRVRFRALCWGNLKPAREVKTAVAPPRPWPSG